MFIKKILLLAAMALGAVALAAPVAAQADPRWYDHKLEEYLPENQHAELHAEGELSFHFPGGMQAGPCETTFTGLAENSNAMAGGTVTNPVFQKVCPTSVEGCTVEPTVKNTPWEVTGTTKITEETGLEIKEITMTFDFIGNCPVPTPTISAKGIATPIRCMPGCLFFNTHVDDLKLEAPFPALTVDVTGVLNLTEPLTLEPAP